MTGDQASPTVTDLRLVAVTPDRSHLVLEDADSRQFRVPVDARLAAALRSCFPRTFLDGLGQVGLFGGSGTRLASARAGMGAPVASSDLVLDPRQRFLRLLELLGVLRFFRSGRLLLCRSRRRKLCTRHCRRYRKPRCCQPM